MAHADLTLIPRAAAQAFADGDERLALTLLARARDLQPAGSRGWAVLERLHGLVLIHVLREVEGTFALERADALLDRWTPQAPRPTLTLLDDRLEPERGASARLRP
ncbi:hypothetical protein GCM10010840_14840 [Deinococcus aerolatus]|uniref:Uncharacterized protein n=1 Tax=Deinococcus aerolatus TaxID=522487 RepID=A0ABQ2G6I9_9DEIO|nr:hypothetical protein [Deinococcus aerolatus]GGL77992.1 hypothetical protein GCM10010840_14840 [Deinococcus aerolatus]